MESVMATFALVIRHVSFKTGLFMQDTTTYRDTCDRHARVCTNFPAIVPLMVNKQVSGHFGEIMAMCMGARLFKLTSFEVGDVQGTIATAAQQIGVLEQGLTMVRNDTMTAKRRADIFGSSSDGLTYAIEAKFATLQFNVARRSVQFLLVNLKPDVPRLVLTIFDSLSSSPRVAVVYVPDHTKLGERRKLMTKYMIAGRTFDDILDKLGSADGAVVELIDILDPRYARLVTTIVDNCNITGGLVDTTMTITKAALEFIIADATDVILTGSVRSPCDAIGKDGLCREIKTSTIAPVCDRHSLQAQLSKIKPDLHEELIAALHLPSEDLLIVIRGFKSEPGTISFSGSTLSILLAAFAEKSGGDKNALITAMHEGLGGPAEVERIERAMAQLIVECARPQARANHLKSAAKGSAKRKAALADDAEARAKHVLAKSEQKKNQRKGYTTKLCKAVAAMPLKAKAPGQTDEEARAEMLEEAAAAERKVQLARHADYERKRNAAKRAKLAADAIVAPEAV